MLAVNDPHWWHPIAITLHWLSQRIAPDARVLEIGPGAYPFARAQEFVDCKEIEGLKVTQCDFAREPLPYPDKSFDFVYCRHVLEDMRDPTLLMKEMSRVGKGGYIECPSPLVEISRGVDGSLAGENKPAPWRGYLHHNYVVWPGAGQLNFVSKYPIV